MQTLISKYLFVFWIFLSFYQLTAQVKYSQPELDRMISAYTYYVVQNITLETLSVKYPHIKPFAENATNEWDKEFLISILNIDRILLDTLKENWLTEKENIIHKYGGTDFSTVTENDAKKYIDLVYRRALGSIQSPVLETLIIYKPGYLDEPENEFSDGLVNTFTTTNLKKKIGIKLKFIYPRTWLLTEINASNCLKRKFTTMYGLGKVTLTFVVENAKNNFTVNAINQFISEDLLKSKIPQTDSFLSYNSKPQVDNLPTGIISYSTKRQGEFFIIDEIHAYYKSYHIQLQFEYSSSKNLEEAQELKSKYTKLNRRIVSNFVVLSQWEVKRY